MYGGQATHIPLKVNQAGVIPVIFAMSFLQFPLTITYFMNSESGAAAWIEKWLSPTGTPGVWVYAAFNVVLIIFFTYFYTSVTFNPVEVAQNMKANPRHPAGKSYSGISEQSYDKNHFCWSSIPGSCSDPANDCQSAGRTQLPFWRNVTSDRSWCCAGYDETA